MAVLHGVLRRLVGRAELSVHLPPLPYALALAPTAESSPAPKIFFQKRPPSERLPPFRGQKSFLGRFSGEGARVKSPKQKSPLRGPSASQMTFEGTDLGLGAACLCSLLRPSQTHRSLA